MKKLSGNAKKSFRNIKKIPFTGEWHIYKKENKPDPGRTIIVATKFNEIKTAKFKIDKQNNYHYYPAGEKHGCSDDYIIFWAYAPEHPISVIMNLMLHTRHGDQTTATNYYKECDVNYLKEYLDDLKKKE